MRESPYLQVGAAGNATRFSDSEMQTGSPEVGSTRRPQHGIRACDWVHNLPDLFFQNICIANCPILAGQHSEVIKNAWPLGFSAWLIVVQMNGHVGTSLIQLLLILTIL